LRHATPAPVRKRRWLGVAAATLAAVAAFWIGRLTAGAEREHVPSSAVENRAAPRALPPLAFNREGAWPPPGKALAPAPSAEVAQPAASLPPALSPERVADVEREAAQRVEETASVYQSRCPSSSGARLTVQLAFDADGREIGRAFSSDKDAPPDAGVLECLRDTEHSSLTVRPPGAPITVTVPFTVR
jgi:hypothetical protein